MAFWDFDGTIIRGDCTEGLVENDRVVYRGLAAETILAGLSPVYSGDAGLRQFEADYPRLCAIGRWLGYPFVAQIYDGVEAERIDAFCTRKFTEVYAAWYFSASMEMLGELERAGVENYVVSASPEVYVRNAADTLGLPRERIVAIRVEIDGGRMTTRVVHPVPYGEGKVENVRELVLSRPNGVAVAGLGLEGEDVGGLGSTVMEKPFPTRQDFDLSVFVVDGFLFVIGDYHTALAGQGLRQLGECRHFSGKGIGVCLHRECHLYGQLFVRDVEVHLHILMIEEHPFAIGSMPISA